MQRSVSEEAAALLLFCVPTACAALLFCLPRATAAVELPVLRLSETEVATALQNDARAALAPLQSTNATALDALFLEQGRMEHVGTEQEDTYSARRKLLVNGYQSLVKEIGEPAALTLRAKAMARFEAAFDLKLPLAKAQVVLGATNTMLDRDGASHDGYLTAPRFVARTIYKARWNLLHGLGADAGFAPVEKRAFYGWQALHVERLALAQRVEALDKYRQAGGAHAAEAWGVLAFRAGEWGSSAQMLEAAERVAPSLRLRNYAKGARSIATRAAREP